MKASTLVIIFVITGSALGLLFLSSHYSNENIRNAEEAMKQKNVFQEIIDSTKNEDPFFNSSLAGKTIVINIWMAQYPPSRNQIPELNKLVKDFANDKTVFIALTGADSVHATDALKSHDLTFSYHLIFGKRAMEINRVLYGQFPSAPGNFQARIPANIVIDPRGTIQIFYTENDPDPIGNIRNYLAMASGKAQ